YVQGLFAQGYFAEVDSQQIQVSGNQVTSRGKVWLNDWRQLGIAPLESIAMATVQNGKISSLSATLTPDSAARLQAAQARPLAAPAQLPRTGEPAVGRGLLASAALLLLAGLTLRRRAS